MMEDFESFDSGFCDVLEKFLSQTFKKSRNERIKSFWCDGVLMPYENQKAKKHANDKRRIETSAYAGIDGQTKYVLIIHFGKHSLSRYAKGETLTNCLPEIENEDVISVNLKQKLINLRLL